MTQRQLAADMAQTSTIAFAVILGAAILMAGLVGIGIYRARYAAAREEGYRTLAGRSADGSQATAEELKGVRAELGEVRQRLAALEKLLSQIG
ncbi:hypothetical protein GCM10010172_44450 [Paractinoplanes ferrugineus]|uniref:Uncharacterized protein n=1 Tax=Paractinoplanes ferrugineus TaxID=113564 RepID=A0A919J5X7_9ACTN|nr:hypothetical protein [Actinoplanes ferrugineus]GIE13603.1 hypothetical protein Afe05nite_54430 [Actinoplanes ferrugineus]